jgi:hypothetical protein
VKAMIFILAIIVTALSVIPCCAFDGVEDNKACTEIEHSEHEHECSVCSPFFSCSSCAGFTLTTIKFVLAAKSVAPNKAVNLYSEKFTSSYFNNFWQPPKIS